MTQFTFQLNLEIQYAKNVSNIPLCLACRESNLPFSFNITLIIVNLFTATDENSLKEEDDDVPILPRIEVVRRLRERLQPIILFGETEIEACQRLRIIEVKFSHN